MVRYFVDTSALVKRYHLEQGSDEVDKLLADSDNRFFISRLAIVELSSSFARLVREGAIAEHQFRELVDRVNDDVAAGILIVASVTSRRLDEAAMLLCTHGLRHHLRTLDAIHLATAQALHGRRRLAGIVAADKTLLAVAADVCGLSAIEVGQSKLP